MCRCKIGGESRVEVVRRASSHEAIIHCDHPPQAYLERRRTQEKGAPYSTTCKRSRMAHVNNVGDHFRPFYFMSCVMGRGGEAPACTVTSPISAKPRRLMLVLADLILSQKNLKPLAPCDFLSCSAISANPAAAFSMSDVLSSRPRSFSPRSCSLRTFSLATSCTPRALQVRVQGVRGGMRGGIAIEPCHASTLSSLP